MKIIENALCSNCIKNTVKAVMLDDLSDTRICLSCLNDAVRLIIKGLRCPDCGDLGIIQDEDGRNSTCPCHLPCPACNDTGILVGVDGHSRQTCACKGLPVRRLTEEELSSINLKDHLPIIISMDFNKDQRTINNDNQFLRVDDEYKWRL
ncbi:MAG: hypothetical protein H7X88_01820 [Gloeobacteraceae cyanobacterium ES-bin-316]|nr:hypothetical protein [Ferruginibacter sp.]